MNIPPEILKNQAFNSHALYFDPINQPRKAEGLQRFHFDAFENIPFVKTFPDGSFEVSYFAPRAKSVVLIGSGGSMPNRYELQPDESMPGYWKVCISDVCPGFHYVEFEVDGVPAMNTQMQIGYGGSYAMNFIDIPDPDFKWDLLTDVPHGGVHMELYKSAVTGRTRNCWVYTPPSYQKEPDRRYPVFYLLHGGGECETDWLWEGHINYILDNMIAAGRCEEMIVVMNCGYAIKEQPDGQFRVGGISDVIVKDCVPFIDAHYRTKADSAFRAVAGLSLGCFLAITTALRNTDVFSSVGLFSGGIDLANSGAERFGFWEGFDYKELYRDAETFNSRIRLMFVGYGEQEDRLVADNSHTALPLIKKGYNIALRSYPGYHEWNVWRRCAFDMASLLFRGEP